MSSNTSNALKREEAPSYRDEAPGDGEGNRGYFPEEDVFAATAPFRVDNDQKAEWCLQKIAEKKAELAKWEAHYTGLLAAVREETDRDIAWFENKLQGYFLDQQIARNTKKTKTQTSYSLPSGKLVVRHREPTYDRKAEELLPWLKQNHPELVKVKEEENWAELKKLLKVHGESMITADAEIVPGITVTPRPDEFKVEFKSEKAETKKAEVSA